MKYLSQNKWLWLIFPLVIVYFLFKDVLFEILVKDGMEKYKKALEKDAVLKDNIDKNNTEANKLVDEAKKSKEERQNDKNEDPDWNLK